MNAFSYMKRSNENVTDPFVDKICQLFRLQRVLMFFLQMRQQRPFSLLKSKTPSPQHKDCGDNCERFKISSTPPKAWRWQGMQETMRDTWCSCVLQTCRQGLTRQGPILRKLIRSSPKLIDVCPSSLLWVHEEVCRLRVLLFTFWSPVFGWKLQNTHLIWQSFSMTKLIAFRSDERRVSNTNSVRWK